jgi:hypothetical protein
VVVAIAAGTATGQAGVPAARASEWGTRAVAPRVSGRPAPPPAAPRVSGRPGSPTAAPTARPASPTAAPTLSVPVGGPLTGPSRWGRPGSPTASPAVGAGRASRRPGAEIFATSNRAVITDPDDPRLRTRLLAFDRAVRRLIRRGGGVARRSQLLDGVFWSEDQRRATFERSRDFDVDAVSDAELHAIADRVRRRFRQESVLTFDFLRRDDQRADALEIVVPGVDDARLRDALVADSTARERLVGGSVTLDGTSSSSPAARTARSPGGSWSAPAATGPRPGCATAGASSWGRRHRGVRAR